MDQSACTVLTRCIEQYPDAGMLREQLQHSQQPADLIPLYDQLIPVIESAMWASGLAPAAVADYHALCTEMESLLAQGKDTRHTLTIVVPVADRPRHLRSCLQSLAGAVQAFGSNRDKLVVVIADDSVAASSIQAHRTLASELQGQGINTLYFGLKEQQAELARLPDQDRQAIQHIISLTQPDDFAHKGASTTRNITYLRLHRLAQQDPHALFMFVDSDQEFHANTGAGEHVYTTNYYYHIDRLFSQAPIEVLTGKVVGDPPVSPAVMAATLLDDTLALYRELATLDPAASCSFHGGETSATDAAYHDMAQLFGFSATTGTHRYPCPLQGPHDHAACLSHFATRLQHFFDGEHPTRRTPYQHEDVQASCTPARTVYTGNYVLTPAALRYFIPFASLQLRMAGPVLGRLVQAASGDAFVSANLPLLHQRTEGESGQSEFRPGIDRAGSQADLSGEFERQYFGDVMLFTVIELVKHGYPENTPTIDQLQQTLASTDTRLRAQYAATRERVMAGLTELESVLADTGAWWQTAEYKDSRERLAGFVANLRVNFDAAAPAWQQITDKAHHARRSAAIVAALASYRTDCAHWARVLQA